MYSEKKAESCLTLRGGGEAEAVTAYVDRPCVLRITSAYPCRWPRPPARPPTPTSSTPILPPAPPSLGIKAPPNPKPPSRNAHLDRRPLSASAPRVPSTLSPHLAPCTLSAGTLGHNTPSARPLSAGAPRPSSRGDLGRLQFARDLRQREMQSTARTEAQVDDLFHLQLQESRQEFERGRRLGGHAPLRPTASFSSVSGAAASLLWSAHASADVARAGGVAEAQSKTPAEERVVATAAVRAWRRSAGSAADGGPGGAERKARFSPCRGRGAGEGAATAAKEKEGATECVSEGGVDVRNTSTPLHRRHVSTSGGARRGAPSPSSRLPLAPGDNTRPSSSTLPPLPVRHGHSRPNTLPGALGHNSATGGGVKGAWGALAEEHWPSRMKGHGVTAHYSPKHYQN